MTCLQVLWLGRLGRLSRLDRLGRRIRYTRVRSPDHAKINKVTEEELTTSLQEGAYFLGRVGTAVLDDHRLLSLAHQTQLVINEFRDHAILLITPHGGIHVMFPHHVIERLDIGVEELVHVPTNRVPQIHAQLQHHQITLLLLTRTHHPHSRMKTIRLAKAQGLHGDVVDMQVFAALQRRQRKRNHTLKLRIMLDITHNRSDYQILASFDPLNLAVA